MCQSAGREDDFCFVFRGGEDKERLDRHIYGFEKGRFEM
jgi:hypothetical protein